MLLSDLTPQALVHANEILAWLSTKVDEDWKTTLSDATTESEYNLAVATIRRRCQEAGIVGPIGAIAEGSGIFAAELGLSGEEVQRAVRLLKDAARLIQAGRGRGKVMVILNTDKVTMGDFAPTAVIGVMDGDLGVAPVDVHDLLRPIEQEYLRIHRLATHLTQRINELEEMIQDKDRELENLRQRLAAQTWS